MRPKQMKLLLAAAMAVFLAGCASYPTVGTKEGDKPPRIVVRDKVRTWDNPGAFGPVPAALADAGRAVCSRLDSDKVKHTARGYHSRAESEAGTPYPKGGYFCVPN